MSRRTIRNEQRIVRNLVRAWNICPKSIRAILAQERTERFERTFNNPANNLQGT